MKSAAYLFSAFFCSVVSPVLSEELIVNLKAPIYSQGVIQTEKGGVIQGKNFRVQGRTIIYTNTHKVQKVFAEGDLLMEYLGQIFVGDKLEFDLKTQTGYLLNGRTKFNVWYMGGEVLELCDSGYYSVENAFITTTPNKANSWKISAESTVIDDNNDFTAQNITLRIGKTPLFWLPYYRGNLNRFNDPPIRYRIRYDKGLGPRFSFRWRFFSTDTFNAFARFDYRVPISFENNSIKKSKHGPVGPGGALEADYRSKNKLTLFQTRNYGALDKNFPNEVGTTRYRFQGIYKTKTKDDYSRLHLQWDKLSDDRMVGDFRDADFELNTQKTTLLEAVHYDNSLFGSLTLRPKINGFQTLNQELPYTAFGIRPLELFSTGIISENYLSGAYLDYNFANKIGKTLRDQESGRFQTINTLYRPISINGVTITPKAGIVGIFYTDSPEHKTIGQFLYKYGGSANFRLSRSFNCFKHTIEPYAQYQGYSQPLTPIDDYFIFSLYDGYNKLNQLQFGFRQLFHNRNNPILLPTFSLDLYGYSFWKAKSFSQKIPKLFADFELNNPNYSILGGVGWNFQQSVLDYGNIEFLLTVNANIALGVEFRHRSRFWWRKAVYDNFVVDFSRSLDDLLASPLSDRRNTLLTKAHLRLTPRWNMHFQSFHGWGRANEPRYNGARVDFYTMLTGSWQMKLSYEYLPNEDYRFSYSFKLIQ